MTTEPEVIEERKEFDIKPSPTDDFFINRLMYLYGNLGLSDVITDILINRSTYEENPDQFPSEIGLIKLYDQAQIFLKIDKDAANRIKATMYWYVYQNFDHEGMPNFVETDDKGVGKLLLDDIAEYLIRKQVVVYWNDSIYIWASGRFVEDRYQLEADIVEILKQNEWSGKNRIVPIIKEIMVRVKKRSGYIRTLSPFNVMGNHYVSARNGIILRKVKGCIIQNSPAFGFAYRLKVNYDPKAPTEPIKKFIGEIVDGEDRKLLIQIAAQALMQSSNFQLSYLFTGDGSNGKSTFIKLTRDLIGARNTASISLQDLVTNRFSTANLENKLINLYADLPKDSLKDTGKFKMLTGGDQLAAEKKFCDAFIMENKAVFVFSANELPLVDDATFAFWRRWAIIEFPHKFKVSNIFIENLITPENLSGFFNLILEDMDRIEQDGLIRSGKTQEIMELWKMRSNSAYAFIIKRIKKSANGWIPKNVLWSEYNKFCIDSDLTEMSKIKFRHYLEKEFAVTDTFIVKDREREPILKGISFIDLNASKTRTDNTSQSDL